MYTHYPAPHTLHPVPWRWLVVGSSLDFSETSLEVHIVHMDMRVATIPEPGAGVEHREEHQREIVGNESVGCPIALEEDSPPRELCRKVVSVHR